jgi:DNA-binding response OmpR family regulator
MARILIVDDEDGIRRILERHFRSCGHEVTALDDFSRARERIDARDYDIAFLDLCMPVMNGGDVCATLRIAQKEDGFDLVEPPPIVIMTGYPELLEKDPIRLIDKRVQCCLFKPFSLREIDEVMACCLDSDRIN